MLQSTEPHGLPKGWEIRKSNSKNLPYYFHPDTKDSRWEPPEGTDPAKLKAYMAEHYSDKGISSTFAGAPAGKIRAAHLLVKHQDSRRPASWREARITRTQTEAQNIIQQYEQKIRNGEITLSDLATTESDCSSARKGGDLYAFLACNACEHG